jgi:hypothetical protein
VIKGYVAAIDPKSEGPFEEDIFFKVLDTCISVLKDHQSEEKTKLTGPDRTLRGLLDVLAGIFSASSKDNKALISCLMKKVEDTELID